MTTNKTYITFRTEDDKEFSVAEWVVNKNCNAMLLSELAAGILKVAKETEKAVLFQGEFGSFWTPKSQMINN